MLPIYKSQKSDRMDPQRHYLSISFGRFISTEFLIRLKSIAICG